MKGKYGYLMGAAVAAAMTFGAAQADAAFITGAFSMTGDFAPTGGASVGTATGIDFVGNDFQVAGTGDSQVTGSFVPFIDGGDSGTITDFSFAPFSGPIDNFWTIGGFEFDLETLVVTFQNPLVDALILSGTGTLSGNGFEATPGTWVFTGNGAGGTFSFSASAAADAVPAPAAIGLLGLGLIGLGAAARRRNA